MWLLVRLQSIVQDTGLGLTSLTAVNIEPESGETFDVLGKVQV